MKLMRNLVNVVCVKGENEDGMEAVAGDDTAAMEEPVRLKLVDAPAGKSERLLELTAVADGCEDSRMVEAAEVVRLVVDAGPGSAAMLTRKHPWAGSSL